MREWSPDDCVHRYKVGELVWLGSSTTIGLILELVPSCIVGRYEGSYKLLIGEKISYHAENVLTLLTYSNP